MQSSALKGTRAPDQAAGCSHNPERPGLSPDTSALKGVVAWGPGHRFTGQETEVAQITYQPCLWWTQGSGPNLPTAVCLLGPVSELASEQSVS